MRTPPPLGDNGPLSLGALPPLPVPLPLPPSFDLPFPPNFDEPATLIEPAQARVREVANLDVAPPPMIIPGAVKYDR